MTSRRLESRAEGSGPAEGLSQAALATPLEWVAVAELRKKLGERWYRRLLVLAESIDRDNLHDKIRKEMTEQDWQMTGIAWASAKKFDKAVEAYTEVIKLKKRKATPQDYFQRGTANSEKGEYDQAIADYNKAIRLRPDYSSAYNNRGHAYAAKREYDQAIADYDKAIGLRPSYAPAYNNRGHAYAAKGEYGQAIADYNEAIGLTPDDTAAYYNRACLYSLKHELEPCLADLEQAWALNSSFKESARTDPALAWAREDERVKKLLGFSPEQ